MPGKPEFASIPKARWWTPLLFIVGFIGAMTVLIYAFGVWIGVTSQNDISSHRHRLTAIYLINDKPVSIVASYKTLALCRKARDELTILVTADLPGVNEKLLAKTIIHGYDGLPNGISITIKPDKKDLVVLCSPEY